MYHPEDFTIENTQRLALFAKKESQWKFKNPPVSFLVSIFWRTAKHNVTVDK